MLGGGAGEAAGAGRDRLIQSCRAPSGSNLVAALSGAGDGQSEILRGRCRRRTWRWCADPPTRTTAVTSTGCWKPGRRTRCWTGPTLTHSTQASIGDTARSGPTRRRFLATWDEVRLEIVDVPLKSRTASWSQRTSHTCEDVTASKFRLEARGCIRFGTASRPRSRSTRRSRKPSKPPGLGVAMSQENVEMVERAVEARQPTGYRRVPRLLHRGRPADDPSGRGRGNLGGVRRDDSPPGQPPDFRDFVGFDCEEAPK